MYRVVTGKWEIDRCQQTLQSLPQSDQLWVLQVCNCATLFALQHLNSCTAQTLYHNLPCLNVQLHGSLPGQEQRLVFQRPPTGKQKVSLSLSPSSNKNKSVKHVSLLQVVLATNIAETSITINDCVFVIDSLKLKEMRFNSRSQMSELVECWTSQVSDCFKLSSALKTLSVHQASLAITFSSSTSSRPLRTSVKVVLGVSAAATASA